MPRSQALLEALLALIGDMYLYRMHIWVYATQFKAMQAFILDTMECAQALLGDCTAAFLFPVRICACIANWERCGGLYVYSIVCSAFRWRHCKQYGGTAASIPSSGSTQYALSLSHFLSLSFCILAWFLFLSVRSRAVGPPRRATRAHPAVPAAHLLAKRTRGSR